jgi:hypothetical protein
VEIAPQHQRRRRSGHREPDAAPSSGSWISSPITPDSSRVLLQQRLGIIGRFQGPERGRLLQTFYLRITSDQVLVIP